jgi:hypothetical protein
MTNTIGGNYDCPKCNFGINDLVYRENISPTAKLEPVPNQPVIGDNKTCGSPLFYGWICPICGRGVSPFTDVCSCQQVKPTVVSNAGVIG